MFREVEYYVNWSAPAVVCLEVVQPGAGVPGPLEASLRKRLTPGSGWRRAGRPAYLLCLVWTWLRLGPSRKVG